MTDKETEKEFLQRFEKYMFEKGLSNECLVQFIELAGQYLNLKTIQKCADDNGKTYNGIKKSRNIVKLFDVKFVIDNC
jgi:hypothetical protein